MQAPIDISVVIPAFNEEENVSVIYERLKAALESTDCIWEIIFINDGSIDATKDNCLQISAKDSRVRHIGLSRNFGHQAALTAGLDLAKGKAVISMDCDMQDPPELVVDMINLWKQGYLVVYGRRKSRRDGFFKKYSAILYYRLLHKFSDYKIPKDVGDFRLVDRKVLDHLVSMREKSRYLRGMVAWLGFKHAFVDYERIKRQSGTTKFTLTRMMRFAMDGIMNFALLPLRIGLLIGMISILAGFSLFFYMLVSYLFFDAPFVLESLIIDVVMILMGFLFILVWLIGEYVGRILDESRGRPLYVIDEESSDDANIRS